MKKITVLLITFLLGTILTTSIFANNNQDSEYIGIFEYKNVSEKIRSISFSNTKELIEVRYETEKGVFQNLSIFESEEFKINSNDKSESIVTLNNGIFGSKHIKNIDLWGIHQRNGTEIRLIYQTIDGPDQEMIYIESGETLTIDYYGKSNNVVYDLGDGKIETFEALGNTKSDIYYPFKNGFQFDGWYMDSNKTLKVTYPFSFYTGAVFYAKWIPLKSDVIKINFINNNNEENFKALTINKNSTLDLEYFVPRLKEHNFTSWFYNESLSERYEVNDVFTKDTTLYAGFETGYVYVNFYNQHNQIQNTRVQVDHTVNRPSIIPKRDGFSFQGWETEDKELYDFTKPVTSTFNLYAKWVRNTDVVITYINKFGETESVSYQPSKIGQYFEMVIPIRTGWKFGGWYLDEEFSKSFGLNILPEENTILYAKWVNSNYATIDFLANGGDRIERTTVLLGSSANQLPRPKKHGYAFLGWFEDSNFEISVRPVINSDLKLYAKWQENSGYIYFETNGGVELSPILMNIGDTLNIPQHPPKRQGYIFTGWFETQSLMNRIDESIIFEEDITIYAGWIIDPDNPPVTETPGPSGEVPYNKLYSYIVVGIIVIGVIVIFKPKKKKGWK